MQFETNRKRAHNIAVILTVAVLSIGSAFAALSASSAFSASDERSPTETLILNVSGMWNEGCEEYISHSLLSDLEGVHEVDVDHENDRVTVELDSSTTSAEEVAAAIENCPFFDVTGSDTHDLDDELIRESRRSCCRFGCRHERA